MEEVGIYRLSGATSEVRRLKDAFDNSEYRVLFVPPRNYDFFLFGLWYIHLYPYAWLLYARKTIMKGLRKLLPNVHVNLDIWN